MLLFSFIFSAIQQEVPGSIFPFRIAPVEIFFEVKPKEMLELLLINIDIPGRPARAGHKLVAETMIKAEKT